MGNLFCLWSIFSQDLRLNFTCVIFINVNGKSIFSSPSHKWVAVDPSQFIVILCQNINNNFPVKGVKKPEVWFMWVAVNYIGCGEADVCHPGIRLNPAENSIHNFSLNLRRLILILDEYEESKREIKTENMEGRVFHSLFTNKFYLFSQ